MIKIKDILTTPSLDYHIKHGLSLHENVYRYSSESFIQLFREARTAHRDGIIHLNKLDKQLLETTDIGEYGLFEGQKVPLDLPMIQESGADTIWEDKEGNKITLQDILSLTKGIPIKQYPTEKLSNIVLKWDNNPEEIERIDQVEVSEKYPILIMANEDGKIQWILDGNHRTQKALNSKSKTIPAKIIKPSMLSDKARKILLNIDNKGTLKENEITPQDKKIADEILSGLNEGMLDGVVDKMKKYASKSLLTLSVLMALTQGLQAQNVPQNDIDSINQTGTELVQTTNPIDKESKQLLKDNLGKQQAKQIENKAKELNAFVTVVKGTNRNAIKSQAQMQAKANQQGTSGIKLVDDSTFSVDGKYMYVMYYQVKGFSLNEAEYQGKDVDLNKPKRGGSKAYYVYVKDGDKVKKVSFGSGGLKAKLNDKEARNSFAKRHDCKNKKDKTKPGYWSCRLPRYAKQLGMKTNYTGFW